ncbi:unnamed protein product [Chrysoparadoxa australica]
MQHLGQLTERRRYVQLASGGGLEPIPHFLKYMWCIAYAERRQLERASVRRLVRARRHYNMRVLKRKLDAVHTFELYYAAYKYRRVQNKEMYQLQQMKVALRIMQNWARKVLRRKKGSAAAVIQAAWRGYITRIAMSYAFKLHKAVRLVQRVWRGFHARYRYRIAEKAHVIQAAKKAQGAMFFTTEIRCGLKPCNVSSEMRSKLQLLQAYAQCELRGDTPMSKSLDFSSICSQEPEALTHAAAEGDKQAPKRRMTDFSIDRTALTKVAEASAAKAKELETDVIDKFYPPPARKPLVVCDSCSKHQAAIHCADCKLRQCLNCSKHFHSKPERMSHDLSPCKRESRAVVSEERCLGYYSMKAQAHVENQGVIRTQEKLAAEDNKAKRGLRMELELKKEEERAERIKKEMEMASSSEHDAAAVLQRLCRYIIARRELPTLASFEKQRLQESAEAAIVIQRMGRGFCVRQFLRSQGIDMRDFKADKEIIHERVLQDFYRRTRYDRDESIHAYDALRSGVRQAFKDDVQWAKGQHDDVTKLKVGAVKSLEKSEKNLWAAKSKLGAADAGNADIEVQQAQLRAQHCKFVLKMLDRQLWWLKMFIRQHYCRNAAEKCRGEAGAARFTWLTEESKLIRELKAFCELRLLEVEDAPSYKFYRIWLKEQSERLGSQEATLDMEQEFLLGAERERLLISQEASLGSRSGLAELLKGLRFDIKLDAEKVASEVAAAACSKESMELVKQMERVGGVKDKQELLREKLLAKLQDQIESTFKRETATLTQALTLTGDSAEGDISEFRLIKAKLKEPNILPRHLPMDRWMVLYKSQPWLARQAAADAEAKAARDDKLRCLDEMKAVLAMGNTQLAAAQAAVEVKRERVKTLEALMEGPPEPPNDEAVKMLFEVKNLNIKIADEEEMIRTR